MPDPCRDQLLNLLREGGAGDPGVQEMLVAMGASAPADLSAPGAFEQLEGVWELRWSSSRQPYLRTGPWIQNLQLLAPSQGRAMNLLRPAGPLAELAGIAVEARIAVVSRQRIEVRFQRGGWLGPRLAPLARRLRLMPAVNQPFPAWLDITVLDDELRICRGNAGTLFALLKRPDLSLADLLPPPLVSG